MGKRVAINNVSLDGVVQPLSSRFSFVTSLSTSPLSTVDIEVPASFQLVRLLMEHDLVDVLRVKILPVVLGAGDRLFGETSKTKAMRLVTGETFEGVAVLTYERVRDT